MSLDGSKVEFLQTETSDRSAYSIRCIVHLYKLIYLWYMYIDFIRFETIKIKKINMVIAYGGNQSKAE